MRAWDIGRRARGKGRGNSILLARYDEERHTPHEPPGPCFWALGPPAYRPSRRPLWLNDSREEGKEWPCPLRRSVFFFFNLPFIRAVF